MTAQTDKKKPVTAEVKGDATCDPITLQIVRGALHSIQREMDALIERTAMSPFIREKKDYYAAIYDAQGQLVAGTAMPSSGDMLPAIVEHYPLSEMKDGDIFWYNDCYASHGAITHSPDQLFVMPAFEDGHIVAFLLTWAHFNDIGGMRPGSLSADCTEIYQEGTIVPPLRVVHEGKPNDEVLRMFFRNSRYPAMIQGDVRAVLASVRLGRLRIHELAHRVGAERMCDAFFQLIERMRAHARFEMRRLIPPGEYRFTESIDSDGHSAKPLKLRYRLEVGTDRIVLDTTESDDQSVGPINFLMSPRAPQMVFGSYLHRHDALFLSNAGAYATLDEVRLRPGSVLQPHFPAPLGFRGVTLMRNVGACLGLLNVATKGNANASHSAYVIYYVRGNDAQGKAFLLSDGIGVGYGARPDSDGNDAIYLTGNENYPAEFLEAVYPLRVRRYAINPDTGGAGRWRGGCGVVRELEVLAPEATVSMRIDSVVFPPWGTNGGQCAGSGRCVVNPGREDERLLAPMSDRNIVRRGDVLRVETGGGGGWGHPYDREVERVLKDVLNGFVSRERALTAYGVVLSEDGQELDIEATLKLREERPATELFHRIHYQEALA
jgi:N-methylhydantoinase B